MQQVSNKYLLDGGVDGGVSVSSLNLDLLKGRKQPHVSHVASAKHPGGFTLSVWGLRHPNQHLGLVPGQGLWILLSVKKRWPFRGAKGPERVTIQGLQRQWKSWV